MSAPRKGWSWFEREESALNSDQESSDDLPGPSRELRLAYARCFSSADGQKVLAHLRALTLERALGPSVEPQVLRHMEGQRQLVTYICALTERGRQGG